MTNRSRAGDRQNPRGASATERAGVIREPIRGLHQGQQPCAAQTGRTHDCTRPASDVEIPLHRRARPHMRPWGRTGQSWDLTVVPGLHRKKAMANTVHTASSSSARSCRSTSPARRCMAWPRRQDLSRNLIRIWVAKYEADLTHSSCRSSGGVRGEDRRARAHTGPGTIVARIPTICDASEACGYRRVGTERRHPAARRRRQEGPPVNA